MCISNVIVTLTYLLTIIVLSGTVCALPISGLDAGSANSNCLVLLGNSRGLVNALQAAQTHSTREDKRQGSSLLSNRSRSKLQTY
jgi:hypothetical protein